MSELPKYVLVRLSYDVGDPTEIKAEYEPNPYVVEVVRCKDCANAMYTENGDIFCDGIRDANWFCADGEKNVTP